MSRTDIRLGTVIAERTLQRRDSPRRTAVVSLGKPRRTPRTQDWECPFQIRGAGMSCAKCGRGVDAFQALTMALQGIRYFLDQSGMPLAWPGFSEDQTGFQRIIPLLPEPGGSRRMDRVVDRELRLRLKKLKRRNVRNRRRVKGSRSGRRPTGINV